MPHQPAWTTNALSTVITEHATTVLMVDDEDVVDLGEGEMLRVNPEPVPLRVSYMTSPYYLDKHGEVGLLYVHLPKHADDDAVYVAFEHYNGSLCMYYITDQMRDTQKIVLISDTTQLKESEDAPLPG